MLVTLGTLTINHIINMIKESEIDELSASLNGLRISHLLACHQAELLVRSEMAANQTTGLTDLNEAVKMIKKEEIEAFFSKIIPVQTKTIFLGSNMHMMMQTLEEGDGPCFTPSLSIMNTYTEVTTGSKLVAAVVKNLTATLIIIAKGIKVTQVVATNAVPQVEVAPGTFEKLDEIQGIQ